MADTTHESLLARRVRSRLAALGKKAAPTSIEAGFGKDFIADIFKGKKANVYGENLQALARVLAVPTAYLTDRDFQLDETPARTGGLPAPRLDGNIVEVPEYDIKVSAGGGYVVDHEDVRSIWRFSRDYLEGELRLNLGHLSIAEVRGDSMWPTLCDGDRVLINHADNNPARPGVYAIWDSDATVVKRLEKIPASDPPQVVLISDNKNHNQYTVPAEYVHVIGRVVWFGRRM